MPGSPANTERDGLPADGTPRWAIVFGIAMAVAIVAFAVIRFTVFAGK